MEEILKERKAKWQPKPPKYTKGTLKLFSEHAVSPIKGGYMVWADQAAKEYVVYNGGIAHALFYGLTKRKHIEKGHLHGEVVSYGTLVNLMVDKMG